MRRYFTRNKARRYVDILPDLVYIQLKSFLSSEYPKSSSGSELFQCLEQCSKVWKTLYGPKGSSKSSSKKPRFRVGDVVRISKTKKTFEKGYFPNWTTKLFTVSKRIPDRHPYVYKIQDYHEEELEGTFYEKESHKWSKRRCVQSAGNLGL